jgi:alpha-beta hydrolase superfamily lysophospholipase
MMVIFQNKIIYMPSVPPFSRSETVAEYAAPCKPVEWKEHDLKAADGTALKLLTGSLASPDSALRTNGVVVVYFQGNASSLPPRLPYLSNILKAASDGMHSDISIVALSYRGFWSSKGSPSQRGIELDARAALDWVLERYDSENIVIWGQSIGAGVACVGAASLMERNPESFKRIYGLLLETPFVDLKAMLVALYPHKILPYRYLAPFLMSTWDSKTALEQIGDATPAPDLRILMLQAGDDEIVPDGQAAMLEEVCTRRGIATERQVIAGALHTDVMTKGQGRRHIVQFLRSFV